MIIHESDRLAGHLTRCQRLGWPVPASLRRAVEFLLGSRGVAVRNRAASAGVLALALAVSSLPPSALAAAEVQP